MKHSKKTMISAGLLLICTIVILSSCALHSENSGSEDKSTNIDSSSASQAQYEISEQPVCDSGETDEASLLIPRLESDKEDFTEVNNLIFQQVCAYFSQFDISGLKMTDDFPSNSESENIGQTSLNGEYEIKYNDDKKLSFVVLGILNNKTAAHPAHYSFGVNIDLQNSQVINIKSMYNFNDDFCEILYSDRERLLVDSEQKDAVVLYLDIQKIRECLDNGKDQFYFTENGIGIIQDGLPYALGDYSVFEIPYERIKEFALS